MALSQTAAEGIKQVQALKAQERASQRISTFKATIEINHDTNTIMVYGGKKAKALGLFTIMRVALPPGNGPIPMPETIARMGCLDISIPSDKVRYACNWLRYLIQNRDGSTPLQPHEEAQLRMAKYIMVGLQEEETQRERRKLRKLAADVDYNHEWKMELKARKAEARVAQTKKALKSQKRKEGAEASQSTGKKKVKSKDKTGKKGKKRTGRR